MVGITRLVTQSIVSSAWTESAIDGIVLEEEERGMYICGVNLKC
jgi:hypothetical protein